MVWCFGLWVMALALSRLAHRRAWLKEDLQGDVLALGGVGLATCGFFWRLLTSDKVWMPAGGGDLVSFIYPMLAFAARTWRKGVVPLWNPHLYAGAPFAADIQSAVFYPVNLAVFFLFPQISYRLVEMLSVFHFFLAGAAMYICLRFLEPGRRMKRAAALLGALAFMFSDLFVTHFGNLNLIAVAAWLPLVFLGLHRALVEDDLRKAAMAGIFLAIAFTAGHIQPFLYILLATGLYVLYRAWLARRGRRLFRAMLAGVVMMAVGLGLAAPVLLPAMELASLSVRAEMTYGEAARYSLPPAALVSLLVPAFFGRGPGGFWGPWDRVETGYAGVVTLFLAPLALILSGRDASRRHLTSFLAFLAVFSLFLAWGGYAILQGWFYAWVPGFDVLRAPARAIYLMDFALAFLAACGLDALLRPLSRPNRKALSQALAIAWWAMLGALVVILPLFYAILLLSQDKDPVIFQRLLGVVNGVSFSLVLLGIGLALVQARRLGRLRPSMLGALMALVLFVDLASTGAYLEVTEQDPTANFHHPGVMEFLRQDPDLFRVDSATLIGHVWQPDTSLLYGLYDVAGIHNPLALRDFRAYWANMPVRASPLYDFLNAKYLIDRKENPGLEGPWWVLVYDGDPGVNVYRNERALPRAMVVHRARIVARHEDVLPALHEEGFHPAHTVVLEKGRPLEGPLSSDSWARIVRYGVNELEVEAYAAAAGYLVLSEVYYPGWQAWVDDVPSEVLRANYAFRAVYLEPGHHRVRMAFRPMPYRVGLLLSVLTAVSLAVGMWRGISFSGPNH